MRLGIGSYAFAWAIGVPDYLPDVPLSYQALLEKGRRLGAECIQYGDNLPLYALSQEARAALKAQADAGGIGIEVGARGLWPEQVMDYLEIADFFESPILRLVVDGQDYEPPIGEVIRIIRDLLPEFRQRNIRLAIENHDRLTAREFVQIVESTDPEWVGICLDSVNSLGADEGFGEVARLLLPYTINLHVKDYTIRRQRHKMGFIVSGTPAGKGMLPIPELIAQLKDLGKCQSAILELWPPLDHNVEATIKKEEQWARESMAYLRNILPHG